MANRTRRSQETSQRCRRTVIFGNREGRRREKADRRDDLAELLALPLIVDIGTAARALGLGRSTGYELARRDAVPVPRAACR